MLQVQFITHTIHTSVISFFDNQTQVTLELSHIFGFWDLRLHDGIKSKKLYFKTVLNTQ